MPHPVPITLFIPCLVDALFPETGEAMVNIFRRLGLPLHYPLGQTCCGQPAFNSGYCQDALVGARRHIECFAAAEAVVCPSGSCVAMVRHHYPELFAEDPVLCRRAQELGAKTFEFSEYLVDKLGITDLGATYTGKVTYHESCHLGRTLGIHDQPRQLLRQVRGLELVEMENADVCCGFGGTFSHHYPEISVALADDKIAGILPTGATTLTGGDAGCLLHLQGRLLRKKVQVRVLHLAQILASQEEA